ncbi:ParB N-terminal domain-containing protein [Desulforhopalus singaporensis]|uniref:ParB-like nuclease domain-containing protein n=1 Tax=Desulforhopalus singaporensis TaxID=91360 RepID=A0A1H0UVW0_9BACT|nr:hypothetical protein [Desulforhopalus singaporensis]SDP70195.1 hypothetical protein SAMN05660330_03750 [Desulforhopalus singaporensis]
MTENTYPIFQELTSNDLLLDNIFLDPNNPRFINMSWDEVPVEKYNDESIQKEVKHKLITEFAVNKLISNMEVNGYLPIDRVIVKEFSENQYVVLEGNRRICAAKELQDKWKKNNGLVDDDIISSLSLIPCLIYTGSDSEASWIFQGLRHIMGVQEWSSFNKAKLLVNLMDEEGLNLTQVGKRFGLSAFGAGQWARGYYAFKQAKNESDYTREVDEKAYPYFQEIFSRSNAPLREWLEWNENEKKLENELNFNELLSWLYPRDDEDLEDDFDESDILGDWRKRKLKSSRDTRNLSYLLRNSSNDFEYFRTEGDLEKAYSKALQSKYEAESKKKSNPVDDVYNSLDSCLKSLDNVPFKMLKDEYQKDKLYSKLKSLKTLVDDLLES